MLCKIKDVTVGLVRIWSTRTQFWTIEIMAKTQINRPISGIKFLATENEYQVDKKVLHNNWLIDKIVVVKVKEGLPARLEYSNSNSIFPSNFELQKYYLESRSAAYEQLKLECWLLYQKSL